jgi:hypothetical protein
MSMVPPTTSGSRKNASGQEAFGSKLPETPMVESPTASAANVTSACAGAGATAASEADKAGTSAPPATEGEGGDHGTSDPQEVPPPQGHGGGERRRPMSLRRHLVGGGGRY